MSTEYTPIENTRSNGTSKVIHMTQFAGGKYMDGVGVQLTTKTEEPWRSEENPWAPQVIQISRDDIPAIVEGLMSYYNGNRAVHYD